jgi:hypothetical protein
MIWRVCCVHRYSHKLMELVRQVLHCIGSFTVQDDRFLVRLLVNSRST